MVSLEMNINHQDCVKLAKIAVDFDRATAIRIKARHRLFVLALNVDELIKESDTQAWYAENVRYKKD